MVDLVKSGILPAIDASAPLTLKQGQGAGAGGVLTLASIIVSDVTTVAERPKYFASIGIAYIFSTLGVVIGAAISQHTTWRW